MTVPTMAERLGDFSANMNPDTNMRRLVTRSSLLFNARPRHNPARCLKCGSRRGMIPAGEQDPIGMAVLNLYPQPTNARTSSITITTPR